MKKIFITLMVGFLVLTSCNNGASEDESTIEGQIRKDVLQTLNLPTRKQTLLVEVPTEESETDNQKEDIFVTVFDKKAFEKYENATNSEGEPIESEDAVNALREELFNNQPLDMTIPIKEDDDSFDNKDLYIFLQHSLEMEKESIEKLEKINTDLFEVLSKYDYLDTVSIFNYNEILNEYGKKDFEEALSITMYQDELKKINWDNFDANNFEIIAYDYFIGDKYAFLKVLQ